MSIIIEHKTIEDFGLTYGLEEELTPDLMVAIYELHNHRHTQAVAHLINTGERIWARTVNKGICEELGIEDFELEKFQFAGMMLYEERLKATMTDEDRELQNHVSAFVDEFMQTFDFEEFYAEKAAAEAEEAMLEEMLKEDE